MLVIARELLAKEPVRVIMILSTSQAQQAAEGFEFEGIEVINYQRTRGSLQGFRDSRPGKRLTALLERLLHRGVPLPSLLFRLGFDLFENLETDYRYCLELLRRLKPRCVLVPDDRSLAGGFLPAMIKACKDLDVHNLIPPISHAGDQTDLTNLGNRARLVVSGVEWFKQAYPKQVVQNSRTGQWHSFYTIVTTRLLRRFGVLPTNPWVLGGGNCALVLADGEECRERYLRAGCAPDKIRITGHVSTDSIYSGYQRRDELKQQLVERYGLDSERPLLLLALPQFAEHGQMSWQEHWDELHFLCRAAAVSNADVLVSLHPKMDAVRYDFIQSDYGIAVAEQPMREIIPAADLFVATFSSTVIWAVLCNIPTLVPDIFRIDYGMFDRMDNVEVISDMDKFEQRLKQLAADTGQREALKKAGLPAINWLSPFDGRSGKRVVEAILNKPAKAGAVAPS